MKSSKETKCECGKGRIVFITYPGSKPVRSCTWTLREYERKHGKSSAVISRP